MTGLQSFNDIKSSSVLNTRIIMLNMARYRKSQVSMISRVTLVWYSSISEIVLKWKTNQQSRWYQEFTSTSSTRMIQLHIRHTNTKHNSTSTSTLKTNLQSRWYQVCTSSTPASPPSSSRCNRGASAGSTRTWDFHDWENSTYMRWQVWDAKQPTQSDQH